MVYCCWREHFLLTLFVFCAISDLLTRKIPNFFVYLGCLACGSYSYLTSGLRGLFLSALPFLTVMIIGHPFYRHRLFGAGDIKLRALLGAYAGFDGMLPLYFRIFFIGGVIGTGKILRQNFDSRGTRYLQKIARNRNEKDWDANKIAFAVPVFLGFLLNLGR